MTAAEKEAIDALATLTSSPVPTHHLIAEKNMLTQSLFAAVEAAALSGKLLQQTNNPETSDPPTIIQIQTGLKTVMDLAARYQSKHSLDLLAQIMDAISTHCEVLGLSPDESTLETSEKTEFWKGVNETWLFAIKCSSNRDDSVDYSNQQMNEEDWIALRDSVIAWGDVLEWYGLVDYEMGFWEEDILDAIHLQIHQLKLSTASNF